MGFVQRWGYKRTTQEAAAARARGDETFTLHFAAIQDSVRDRRITVTEAQGWKLAELSEEPAPKPKDPRRYWVMTYHRAEAAAAALARAARDRGDEAFTYELATIVLQDRDKYIAIIESEGWTTSEITERPKPHRKDYLQHWTVVFRPTENAEA